MQAFLRVTAAFLTLCIACVQVRAAPDVAASIKPVHALVAGVMEGVGHPRLIIPGSASPHAYSLKPSEARALARADVVFWVGPQLETVLKTPISSLAGSARVVSLIKLDTLTRWPVRTGGAWTAHGGDAGHGHHHGHEHGKKTDHHHPEADKAGQAIDQHVWLDPSNAKAMTDAIAAALGKSDPGNAARYLENARRQNATLDRLTVAIGEKLKPVAAAPFLVFHDAYQYFERRFGLNSLGAVAISPDRQPGPRQLAQLRMLMREHGIGCLFAEPQFPSRIVKTLVSGTSARVGILDPLGTDIPAGPALYASLLDTNAQALLNCLSATNAP